MRQLGGRVRIMPLLGESASSLVLRAAVAMSPYPTAVVGQVLGKSEYLASTMSRISLAETIADFVGLPVAEIMPTMIHAHEDPGLLRVGEFVLRADQIMQTPLRLAPDRLAADVQAGGETYHRLVWVVRALATDPDSGAPLSGHCSNCRITLTWQKLRELGRCSSCGRPSWTAKPDVAPPASAAAFRAALFRSSSSDRAEFRRRLPPQTVGWHEADLLSLLDTVAALQSAPDTGSAADAAASVILGGVDDLIGVMRLRVASYLVPGGRLSEMVAYARLTGDIERSPSQKTRDYLKALIGAV